MSTSQQSGLSLTINTIPRSAVVAFLLFGGLSLVGCVDDTQDKNQDCQGDDCDDEFANNEPDDTPPDDANNTPEPIVCVEVDDQPQIFELNDATLTGYVERLGSDTNADTFLGWDTSAALIVTHTTTGAVYAARMDDGPGTPYELTVPAGQYNIDLRLQGFDGFTISSTISLAKDVELSGGTQNQNFGVVAVPISGQILLGGQDIPEATEADPNRGNVIFKDVDSDFTYSVRLEPTGPSELEVILPGNATYEVLWHRRAILATGQTDPIPVGVANLGRIDVSRPNSWTFDSQQPVLELSGEVFLQRLLQDRQELPADEVQGDDAPRALLQFVSALDESWDTTSVSLGHRGPGLYNIRLMAGSYAVIFDPQDYSAGGALENRYATHNLCGEDLCEFGDSGTVDFGLMPQKYHSVSGRVEVLGRQWAQSGLQLDGSVYFRDEDTGDSHYMDIAPSGVFVGTAPAGRYTVELSTYSGLPGSITLATGVEIDGPNNFDFEVRAVRVRGELKVNGQTMADNGLSDEVERAVLNFWQEDAGNTGLARLGVSGPATFDVFMVPGEHEVHVSSYGNGGHGLLTILPQDVLPNGHKEIGTVQIPAQEEIVELDLNVNVLTYQGQVQNIEAFADSNAFEPPMNALRLRDLEERRDGYGPGIWNDLLITTVAEDGSFEMLAYEGAYEVAIGNTVRQFNNPVVLEHVCLGR